MRYRPLLEEAYDDEEGEPVVRDQTEAIEAAVDELHRDTAGDVLVFLPGEREIRDTADALKRKAEGRGTASAASTSSRSTRGSPPPSSTASSSGTPAAGWCWPPTSRRPR